HALAIKRLESATRNVSLEYNEANAKERKAPGLAYYYLGKAYHFKNQFDRAVSNYYNYRSFIEMDDVATYNKVRLQIQYAENAMELIKNPVGVKIINLGPDINTKYSEYCPIVSADGQVLIFTSRREGGTGIAVDDDGNFYEDIYICHKQKDGKWSKPKSIGANINSAGHEAAIGLSPDGQLLFIYKDDNNDGNVYFSRRKGEEDWSKPLPMGSDVNTKSWETHATVNATQDLLIFVSNRTGGYGGRDLWYSKKLPDGNWGLAQNIGSVINTQYEEDSPFLTVDGNTLIFSSQGHTSMGGFDIFRSEFVDGAWTAPENIGYPINTSEDDVFFSLTPDGQHAYYSSRMDGGYGDTDLYKLRLEKKKSDGVAVARGIFKVPAMDYVDISAQIIVTDEGGAQLGTYRPNSSTGYYVLILSPGETYTISYEADGYETVVAQVPIADDEVYAEYEGVVELEDVVFGENILALQDEKARLEKEKEAAVAKTAEQERLAAEAAEKAKQEAEALAINNEKNAEREKAEKLAEQEKTDAAAALAAEQQKTKDAELERKKAEARAKVAAKQEQAAKEAKESELVDAAAKEKALVEATEKEKALAEQEALATAKAAEEKTKVEEALAKKKEAEAAAKAEEDRQAQLAVEQVKIEAVQKAEEEKIQTETIAVAKAEEEKREVEQAVAQVATEEKRPEPKVDEAKELAAAQQLQKEQQEADAKRLAAAELKKQGIQERINALKKQRAEQEREVTEVKEVQVQKMQESANAASVDAKAIKAKREVMLARIEQLKKRKAEVGEKKVVDEEAVVEAPEKEKVATVKKEKLVAESFEKREELAELQKALKVVEQKVDAAEEEVQKARDDVAAAEKKVAEDIAEEKRIAEEEEKKKAEALEAERQIKEIEELERKRIEAEQAEAKKFEEEQRAEAERTKRELMQLEALAEQQQQVKVALELEKEKKRRIDAAEGTKYSQEDILSNAETLTQLRALNRQLIEDNFELKKQLAELNTKLDLILARLDYTPDVEKVELPKSSTLKNLESGRRLILRNIFFDYNR
ncbi:MAG: PD40 domain-containing protein, partial [Flavobacteriales bacterium]|nr:PD40 domain-containing protein [Flavobacteriales bacterium]